MSKRCFGTGKGLLYEKYHDEEWGVPVHEDRHLFEMLCLEGAQAGLSWEVVLNKRQGYRRLFHQFEPSAVASMTDSELENRLQNPAIIRNRHKVFSMRGNAKIFLTIQKEFNTFDAYLWEFVNHQPIINHWGALDEVPARSAISDHLAKDLKKRGMRFVGKAIMYAYMQAVGMVNDHLITCPFRHRIKI